MNRVAPITPPSQDVFTQEFLHSECARLEIPPCRPNYRRVRRAWDIFQNRQLQKSADGFFVESQSGSEAYLVSPDLSCTCPDSAQKQNHCKHAIAVQLTLEHERDYNAWSDSQNDARHIVDPSLSHLMPDSYERLLMNQ